MFIQVMPEKDAAKCPYHPFDLSKVWFHKDYPRIEVGVMERNRNPENYFAEVEQSAFNPANIVPGIGFSPDKMLQGRLFSYGDAQRYRLGVNHHLIPVNASRCPFHSYHRDGAMRVDGNHGSTLGYEPNSYGEWQQHPDFAEPPLRLEGAADRWNHREDDDYYSQPCKLFRLMNAGQMKALFENTARAMGDAPKEVKVRHIGNCLKADPAYGKGVADALGNPAFRTAEDQTPDQGSTPWRCRTPLHPGSRRFLKPTEEIPFVGFFLRPESWTVPTRCARSYVLDA